MHSVYVNIQDFIPCVWIASCYKLLIHAILQNLYILRTLDGRATENKIPADMMRFPAGLPATIGWLCQWYVNSHTSQTCWILIIEPITCRTFPVVLAEQFRHLENSSIKFSSNTKKLLLIFWWSLSVKTCMYSYLIIMYNVILILVLYLFYLFFLNILSYVIYLPIIRFIFIVVGRLIRICWTIWFIIWIISYRWWNWIIHTADTPQDVTVDRLLKTSWCDISKCVIHYFFSQILFVCFWNK